jgi:hypothetical protein
MGCRRTVRQSLLAPPHRWHMQGNRNPFLVMITPQLEVKRGLFLAVTPCTQTNSVDNSASRAGELVDSALNSALIMGKTRVQMIFL